MPPPSNPHDNEKQAAAQQAVDILHEISTILVGSRCYCPPNPQSLGGAVPRLANTLFRTAILTAERYHAASP